MNDIPEIIALILCGGSSSRMGKDKAMLHYHGQSQYLYLTSLCSELGLTTYLSVNSNQHGIFANYENKIIDNPLYSNAGPMTGLLSAFHQFPDNSILLLACDYPLIQKENIELLISTFKSKNQNICYHHPEHKIDEALLAIYHPNSFAEILERYNKKETSLRYYLSDSGVCRIKPNDLNILKSFDTPEDFAGFIAQ